ncbi:DUF294 nucleotidyltransferase-like domain-containing protein [Aquisalimonas sp.]|uniref:DUF294 nucleotidyltransferase-like domain-containing protein n=1 Tax=Aquisalimonas sp. TaxID=1872621 RepID=UPI0025C68A57|nr:DUF294 nucleotidyltransferase-like domain-containing protein [Aquisalimonas sp.]
MNPLFQRIFRCESVDELSEAAIALPHLQGRLVDVGLAGPQQGLVVTAVIDALTQRLIELGEAHLGPAPGAYAWLASGSQGRREQTFHTDQDNALILADDQPRGADAWYQALGTYVTDGLAACGISHCPGGVGPQHAEWRRSVSGWRKAITAVIRTPGVREVMVASHYFDWRCIHGEASLFPGIRRAAADAAASSSLFLARVEQNALRGEAPLGAFRRLRVKRRAPDRGTFNLKQQAMLPLSQLALAYALKAGVVATNTVDRITAAAAAGLIPRAQARDLQLALETVTGLRARFIVEAFRRGTAATNRIDPAVLSELELAHLKSSLGAICHAQRALRQGHAL